MTQVQQRTIETRNPANPGEVVARVPLLEDREIEGLVQSALDAAPDWSSSVAGRSVALNRWADDLEGDLESTARLIVQEVGKPIQEARGEVSRGVAILRYYAQAAYDPIGELYPSPDGRARLAAERVPLGTVLTVTPWNFPAAAPIWKIAAALAFGNSVIFKPSSAAVGTASRLAELAHRNLPEGVLGLAAVASDRARTLVEDRRIAGVSFTGSVEVGEDVVRRAASRGGAVQAEMGGQNPSIVLEDAFIPGAAQVIASAAMAYAGQKCTATSRVIVSAAIADELIDALVDAIASLRLGDPQEAETVVGPLISESARSGVADAVDAAVGRGATILTGGDGFPGSGWYYRPTLLRVVDRDDPFAQEEVFGPAAAVLVARHDDEVVAIANSTRYGLSAAVFSEDVDRATRLARRVNCGLIRVNASTTGVDFYAPFGGEGASSYGPREQGRAAREFYTRTRTLLINPPLAERGL